jgi:hypothetical protein
MKSRKRPRSAGVLKFRKAGPAVPLYQGENYQKENP